MESEGREAFIKKKEKSVAFVTLGGKVRPDCNDHYNFYFF